MVSQGSDTTQNGEFIFDFNNQSIVEYLVKGKWGIVFSQGIATDQKG